MALQLECPSCTESVKAPDSAEGTNILCPRCAYSFLAVSDNSASAATSAPRKKVAERPRARSDDRLQTGSSPRRTAPVSRREEEDEPTPRKTRRASSDRPRKSGNLLLPLLFGGGAAAFLFLVFAGVGLWWLLSPAKKPARPAEVATTTSTPGTARRAARRSSPRATSRWVVNHRHFPPRVASRRPVGNRRSPHRAGRNQGLNGQPSPRPARRHPAPVIQPDPPVGPPLGLPASLPSGAGKEEFVDLPARGTGLSVVPGLAGGEGPPPEQPPAQVPAGKARVQLSNGFVGRARGKAGTTFTVAYRFTAGAPVAPGGRFTVVLLTARGRGFRFVTVNLRPQGALTARATGITRLDAPYQAYVVIERLMPGGGWQEVERVSDVLTFR